MDDDKSTVLGTAPLIVRRVVRARVADAGGEAQKVAAMVTEIQAAETIPRIRVCARSLDSGFVSSNKMGNADNRVISACIGAGPRAQTQSR